MTPLATLVGDVDEFGGEFWGRAPLHRQVAAGTSPIPFGVTDVDRVVTSAVRVPAIRLVRDGERVDPSRFCTPTRIGNQTLDDVADPRKVLDEYRRGATVVIQTLHRTWAPMSAWCAELEAELGWPVQCNAYLSPPSSAGLAKHADGHDVFAVQLHGTKHWFVDGLGELAMGAGHVLYMPSGVEHVAGTEDDPSLHLTIGVHRPSATTVARAALATTPITPTAPPVPIGPAADLTATFVATLADMRGALGQLDVDVDVDIDREQAFAARLRRRPRVHAGGLLDAAVRRSPVGDSTRIVGAPGFDVRVDGSDGRLLCSWQGGSWQGGSWQGGALRLPAIVADALRLIVRSAGPVVVGDLPGLDAADRTTLVRRLVDEGAVAVVD